MKTRIFVLSWALWCLPIMHGEAAEQMELSEPAFTSDPTTGTQIKAGHIFLDEEDGKSHTAELELELAIAPWASVELTVPYTFQNPDAGRSYRNLDGMEIALKLANYRFAESGVVLGAGLEIELPTGEDRKDIGSNNEINLEPYIAVGVKSGNFEVISTLNVGIPANQSTGDRDAVDLEIGFNTALTYHAAQQHSVFMELDGETVVRGEDDELVINGTAGVLWRPFDDPDIVIGAGASIPLSEDEEFSVRSKFWISSEF